MDLDNTTRQALEAALTRLLRPLVRLLLRHAMPFAAFEALAKQVYVDVAMQDFALEDRKPSISRASILTGLTRKDVQRRVNPPEADEPAERYNRAARVLTGWVRDRDFTTALGAPRPLAFDGDDGFAALVRRHSGDMPARAVLDELLRVGSVRQLPDQTYVPVARAFVPRQDEVEKIAILGSDVADLVATIDHNLQHGADNPRFQRKVMYHAIPVDALPAFRVQAAAQSQALLERLDRWLAAHDDDAPAEGPDVARARVGVGIYYFDERLSPPATEGDPR